MRTNVMIRIDAEAVQAAKNLDLNISRICEVALTQAIEEETRPFGIVESDQISLEAQLFYYILNERLGIGFIITNGSDENIIMDRINYFIEVKRDEDNQTVQDFKGTVLERRTISKRSMKETFGDSLKPSTDLIQILKETTRSDRYTKGLKCVIVANLFVNSKKGIKQGKFEQVFDKNGMPGSRSINVV